MKLFTTILLFLALAYPAVVQGFSDVFQASYFFDAIQYVKDRGIVKGYPDNTFRETQKINRAEFTKIIIATTFDEDEISNCSEEIFTDVPSDQWYFPYVCMAYKNQIIKGYPDNTFKPEKNILFPEAAKILVKTLNVEYEENEEALWYEPYVAALMDINSIPDNIWNIEYEISRGQLAEMVYRIQNKIRHKKSKKFPLSEQMLLADFKLRFSDEANLFFRDQEDRVCCPSGICNNNCTYSSDLEKAIEEAKVKDFCQEYHPEGETYRNCVIHYVDIRALKKQPGQSCRGDVTTLGCIVENAGELMEPSLCDGIEESELREYCVQYAMQYMEIFIDSCVRESSWEVCQQVTRLEKCDWIDARLYNKCEEMYERHLLGEFFREHSVGAFLGGLNFVYLARECADDLSPEKCQFLLAHHELDQKYCEYISDENIQEACRKKVLLDLRYWARECEPGDQQGCESMNSLEKCELIENQELMNRCKRYVEAIPSN